MKARFFTDQEVELILILMDEPEPLPGYHPNDRWLVAIFDEAVPRFNREVEDIIQRRDDLNFAAVLSHAPWETELTKVGLN